MSDLPHEHGMNTPDSTAAKTLASALRGLAQVQPETSLWPALEASLLHRQKPLRTRWSYALPAALAASIALLALPFFWRAVNTPQATSAMHSDVALNVLPADPKGVDAMPQINALRQQSQVLEGWLSAARNSNSSARDLLASSEIEDMIGLVDVQLAASDKQTDALPLWRQRIALLQDLAALRYTGASLAANGISGETVPASPTTWIN
ncbi:hypothetical protein ELE36_16835 [Pseudolysobacter antarcticus]|uniref:Uncharacterized protein n=1 Tax=Pseudolysobacter antarcticus TaxID=2511995 RepID=A0A411HN30_9GAMM|nr:hypothetical protein [Pseudolysobacter antarcticus]QBB71888.1 hypothetical protein ELE36_16835 [Pseudolysobacter antarcticus]